MRKLLFAEKGGKGDKEEEEEEKKKLESLF